MRFLLAVPLLFAFACSHQQQGPTPSEEQQQSMEEGAGHEGCACGEKEHAEGEGHEGCGCPEGECACDHEHHEGMQGGTTGGSEDGSDTGTDDGGMDSGDTDDGE